MPHLLPAVHELDAEPALRFGDRELSYRELRDAAAAVAERLHGVQRAAVWAESTLETCVAIVGGLSAGVPLVPLNPKLGSSELAHILSDSEPELVLGAPEGALDAVDAPPPVAAVDMDARGGALPSDAELDDDHTALVIYTSGTTGRPKGALMPRRAVSSNLDALADAWAWTREDRLVHALPLFHVHGLVLGTLGPLRLGGHVRHLVRFDAKSAAAALREGATMLFGVPTMYHRIAAEAEADGAVADGLKAARLLVSGSAPLPAPLFTRIERATGQQVAERYGLTETLMNTAVRADGERRPGYVGPPLPGTDLRLVADEGHDITDFDDETIGEVAVRGPNVFTGYLNRPDATAEAMRDGWFFTGDLATRAPDGYVRIVGRRSTDLIKTGGYKVGAGEIEVALLEHPAVSEVAVTAGPDEDLGERIIAWVVAQDTSTTPDPKELIDHVAQQLAPHKRPREVHFLDELPRNAMGKVVKQRLGAS
jgi:malonyl-CoA/methylmalonyl-CoA synthetase